MCEQIFTLTTTLKYFHKTYLKNPRLVSTDCQDLIVKSLLVKRSIESENESDIAAGWVHKESNFMSTLISDKDQRKLSVSLSLSHLLSIKEPYKHTEVCVII